MLVAALCYIADGATEQEYNAAISRIGAMKKICALRRLPSAIRQAFNQTLTPSQSRCIFVQLKVAYPTISSAVTQTQAQLREELADKTPEELEGLTQEQVNQEVGARFDGPINEAVATVEEGLKNCTLPAP